MKNFKHRVVVGVIVANPLGVPDVYRSPILIHPFVETVFDRNPPNGLDVTVTLENMAGRGAVSGHFEIVYGTIEMMKNSLAAVKKEMEMEPTERVVREGPATSSFIQLGIGSKEFCQVFARFWAASMGNNSAQKWEHLLLAKISTAELHDVIWVDILSPIEILDVKGSDMMRRNIASMVM